MAFRTNKMPTLQEKSASGAVASFNTALAMPLVECKTEFMCTQEAGTPSPSNPLPITGVDSVAIQKSGQNIMQESFEVGSISSETGWPTLADDRIRSINYSPCLPNTQYYFVIPNKNLRILYYDDSYGFINYEGWYDSSRIIRTPVNCHYIKLIGSGAYGTTYNNDISINVETTDTAYHPYISNTVTLIDLDGTRYGGYVDVVRKKLVVDKTIYQYVSENCYATQLYIKSDACAAYIFNNNVYPRIPASKQKTNYCNKLKFNTVAIWALVGYANQWCIDQNTIIVNISNDLIGVTDPSQETTTTVANKIKNYLMVEKPIFTIPIEPIEISLSDIPTLSTIIGNNSFASDSGSIELKYKDLDIAKRGNFREVFKLPS